MDEYLRKLSKLKIIVHIIVLFGIMFIGDFMSSIPFDLVFRIIRLPYGWMYGVIRRTACIGVTYLLFLLYTKRVLHCNMEFFRSGKPEVKVGDLLFALALPAFVISSFAAIGKFSFNENITMNAVIAIIFNEITAGLKAGILEEVLFRGYIMKLIEVKWNRYIAVIVPSLIFALLHIPSMQKISFLGLLLLICSGTLAGSMFSLVAYKDNCIWGSALIHTVWNSLVGGSIFSIGKVVNNEAVFSITHSFNSPLLTGSDFGIEASIIAMTGYIIVSLLTARLIRKELRDVLGKVKLQG